MMTIAMLARAADTGVETIRYYQRRGLMPVPERTGGSAIGGGIRRYGDDDLRRLRFIRGAQGAGFTLEEIGELLSLDATQDRARVHALATERLAALDRRIAALEDARAMLRGLADRCVAGGEATCPIIAAFAGDDRSGAKDAHPSLRARSS